MQNDTEMKLTEKQILSNSGIPTSEIESDLRITEREINQFQKEIDAMSSDRKTNRVGIYMREGKISQRRSFIESLQSILDYRNKLKTA